MFNLYNQGQLSCCHLCICSPLGRGQLEEAEAVRGVGVRVDHDVARVGVIAQPLPSVVTVLYIIITIIIIIIIIIIPTFVP